MMIFSSAALILQVCTNFVQMSLPFRDELVINNNLEKPNDKEISKLRTVYFQALSDMSGSSYSTTQEENPIFEKNISFPIKDYLNITEVAMDVDDVEQAIKTNISRFSENLQKLDKGREWQNIRYHIKQIDEESNVDRSNSEQGFEKRKGRFFGQFGSHKRGMHRKRPRQRKSFRKSNLKTNTRRTNPLRWLKNTRSPRPGHDKQTHVSASNTVLNQRSYDFEERKAYHAPLKQPHRPVHNRPPKFQPRSSPIHSYLPAFLTLGSLLGFGFTAVALSTNSASNTETITNTVTFNPNITVTGPNFNISLTDNDNISNDDTTTNTNTNTVVPITFAPNGKPSLKYQDNEMLY